MDNDLTQILEQGTFHATQDGKVALCGFKPSIGDTYPLLSVYAFTRLTFADLKFFRKCDKCHEHEDIVYGILAADGVQLSVLEVLITNKCSRCGSYKVCECNGRTLL